MAKATPQIGKETELPVENLAHKSATNSAMPFLAVVVPKNIDNSELVILPAYWLLCADSQIDNSHYCRM